MSEADQFANLTPTLLEPLLDKLNLVNLQSLAASSLSMAEKIDQNPRAKNLLATAEKVKWFCKRVKRLTTFEQCTALYKRTRDPSEMGIMVDVQPKEIFPSLGEEFIRTYFAWGKSIKKWVFMVSTQINAEQKWQSFRMDNSDFVELMVKLWLQFIPREIEWIKNKVFGKAFFMYRGNFMSMDKMHDIWFFRVSMRFEMGEQTKKELEDIPVLKAMFTRFKNTIALVYSDRRLFFVGSDDSDYAIPLDWEMFIQIMPRLPEPFIKIIIGESKMEPYWQVEPIMFS